MYSLAPYFEEGERIVHARRGAGTVTDHVGAGGTRTCVRYDSGALRRYKSTLALAPPDPRAHAAPTLTLALDRNPNPNRRP